MYFVVLEGDVVFVYVVPFLEYDFFRLGADLRTDEQFKCFNCVCWVAFDTYFLALGVSARIPVCRCKLLQSFSQKKNLE